MAAIQSYVFPLASCSLLLLSELQWYDDRRRLQRTALCTQCVPHVNYSIHGHVLIVSRAQGFQERLILSLEGKHVLTLKLKNLENNQRIGEYKTLPF